MTGILQTPNINVVDSQPRPRLVRNAIECAYCGLVLESKHRHDFQAHSCEAAGKTSKSYDHDLGEYADDYPMIFVDGGLAYQRTGGDRRDFIDRSEWV